MQSGKLSDTVSYEKEKIFSLSLMCFMMYFTVSAFLLDYGFVKLNTNKWEGKILFVFYFNVPKRSVNDEYFYAYILYVNVNVLFKRSWTIKQALVNLKKTHRNFQCRLVILEKFSINTISLICWQQNRTENSVDDSSSEEYLENSKTFRGS